MRFILFCMILLTQCAWGWPSGWQQNPAIPGSVATTNTTLDASQVGQVIVFNNSTGVAANGTQFSLPIAVVGMQYTIIADTAKWFYVKPGVGDIINFSTNAANNRISNKTTAAIGDSITLVCQTANQWSIQAKSGTWTTEGNQAMNIIVRPGLTNRTFEISDQDTGDANYFYYGYLTTDSNWIIQRQDNTVSNVGSYRYATVKNNAAYNAYSSAWTARAALTYDYFNVAGI